ncbi:alpha/beta hydrolase family protein [Acrocarpospora sp. B8E8]|uniref:alpha/beta hydrolase n=1 Tax=Acrocarpospora sp. B8E8 TaxID=3153572 RepID=UPI00325E0152
MTRRWLWAVALVAVAAIVVAVIWWPQSDPASSDPAPSDPAQPSTDAAMQVASPDPRTRVLTVQSAALGRQAKVTVLLPPGWAPGSGPWPVLYLLHGCCQSSTSGGWLEDDTTARVTATARALIVIPEGGPTSWYSDWLDGPKWETFHLKELLAILERDFGAGDRRAIAGLSMGGLGAMGYAARNPGMFLAAASYSGVLDSQAQSDAILDITRNYGEDPAKLWGLDPSTSVWDDHNPANLTDRLKGIRLYVSCGDGTPGPLDPDGAGDDSGESFLLSEAKTFVKRAEQSGLDVTTDFYGPGTHTWPYWSRALERSLPMLMEALTA